MMNSTNSESPALREALAKIALMEEAAEEKALKLALTTAEAANREAQLKEKHREELQAELMERNTAHDATLMERDTTHAQQLQ